MEGESADPRERVHVSAANRLRERIVDGTVPVGARLPSEVDLARELGISRVSLRAALAIVAAEGLVRRVAGRGTFVVSPETRNPPVGKKPRRVAVIMSDPGAALCAQIIAGITDAGSRLRYEILLDATWGGPEREVAALEAALGRGDDGVILFPCNSPQVSGALGALQASGVPVVLVDRGLPGTKLDVVCAEHEQGGREAVERLLQSGHREIAFLTPDDLATRSVAERWLGYREALAAAQIPFRWDRMWVVPDGPAWSGDREAIAAHLAAPGGPTAVFALHDHLALSLLMVAHDMGLRVPQDLSVVGFDGLEEGVRMVGLSTMRQPAQAIGERAALVLLDRMTGQGQPAPIVCKLPVEFLPGHTIGQPAAVPGAGPLQRPSDPPATPQTKVLPDWGGRTVPTRP